VWTAVGRRAAEPTRPRDTVLSNLTLTGEQLAAITRALVQIKSQHYGKGATEAKAYQCDDFLFCVLKGGMTTAERNLLEHGDAELVRHVRLRFQHNNSAAFKDAVERITGRRVLTYESQVLFEPDYTIEIFVLDDRSNGPASPSRAG
jgi:uncharacterized protein YbcI